MEEFYRANGLPFGNPNLKEQQEANRKAMAELFEQLKRQTVVKPEQAKPANG